MEECKNCIHEKVCVIKAFPDAFENTQWEKDHCEHFKDADVVPKSDGEWVENEDDFWILCSVCGIELWDEQDDKRTPYCPFCGAKMNGIKKEFNHGGFESQALS